MHFPKKIYWITDISIVTHSYVKPLLHAQELCCPQCKSLAHQLFKYKDFFINLNIISVVPQLSICLIAIPSYQSLYPAMQYIEYSFWKFLLESDAQGNMKEYLTQRNDVDLNNLRRDKLHEVPWGQGKEMKCRWLHVRNTTAAEGWENKHKVGLAL